MRICLIHPLIQSSLWENDLIARWPPLGLAYIASYLEHNGHSVKIIERRRLLGRRSRNSGSLKDVDRLTVNILKEYKPQIVGITATTPLITDAYRTAKLVKDLDNKITVVVGGAHPTAEPNLTLWQCPYIDVVCRGEGESVTLDLANGVPLEQINGIVYRHYQGVRANPCRKLPDTLDHLPYPAYNLLDRDYYFSPTSTIIRGLRLKATTVLTARGCPYHCSFCQSEQLVKSQGGTKQVRFHSPEYIIEELDFLMKNFSIEGLLFAEDIFSLSRQRTIEICRLLINKGLHKKLKWAANLRPDSIDKGLLELMRDSGCVRIILGCESGSQQTLNKMGKELNLEINYQAVSLARKTGISCEVNIIFGFPGEEKGDILDTLKFLKRSRPDRINRGKLYPIPGTRIYRELVNNKAIKKLQSWDELFDKYVLSDFAFSNISQRVFSRLLAKIDREATLPTNYMFAIKSNLKRYPALAIKQIILMFIHCSILYFNGNIYRVLRKMAGALRIKSRYVFE